MIIFGCGSYTWGNAKPSGRELERSILKISPDTRRGSHAIRQLALVDGKKIFTWLSNIFFIYALQHQDNKKTSNPSVNEWCGDNRLNVKSCGLYFITPVGKIVGCTSCAQTLSQRISFGELTRLPYRAAPCAHYRNFLNSLFTGIS